MQDANALIEELENTNDIKKTIKILKKLKLNELSPNILMKIRNIISNKDYMRHVKKLTDDGSGAMVAALALLIFVPTLIGAGISLALAFNSIDILITSILGGSVLAIGTKLLIDSFKKEIQKEPSKKQKDFIKEYQELLEELIIEPTKLKEKTIKSNAEEDLDLISIIIKARLVITTRCNENNKEKYNIRLESLIKVYKQKIHDIDSNLQDTPDFAKDYKSMLFKKLEESINELLEEASSSENYEQHQLETLIDTLNKIVMMEDVNKKISQYIELSNKLCVEATPENVTFNALAIETIAEYYLVLIEQNSNLNLRWFLPQLNPIYYDAILNLLIKKLNLTYDIEIFGESTKLQNIENLSSIYINKKQGIGMNNMLSRAI